MMLTDFAFNEYATENSCKNRPASVIFLLSKGEINGEKGRTSGSRVVFSNEEHGSILLHKPHPQKELKEYQVRQLLEHLEQEGLI